jgi:hypothetical protein
MAAAFSIAAFLHYQPYSVAEAPAVSLPKAAALNKLFITLMENAIYHYRPMNTRRRRWLMEAELR